jgi:pyruvate dehydrogenase complex dehydrogenase (E1) component
MKKIMNYFRKTNNQQHHKKEPETQEQQIKNCLYKFWEYCNNGGYQLQGYKDGVLLPEIITCEITGIEK